MEDCLFFGNLDAKRDWGHAKDYVEASWLMLQQDKPDDYVISSDENHSVREFIDLAAQKLDMKIEWYGKGIKEIGVYNNKEVIKIDEKYYRPTEVNSLIGDSSYSRKKLGWYPKTSFEELVEEMVKYDFDQQSHLI